MFIHGEKDKRSVYLRLHKASSSKASCQAEGSSPFFSVSDASASSPRPMLRRRGE